MTLAKTVFSTVGQKAELIAPGSQWEVRNVDSELPLFFQEICLEFAEERLSEVVEEGFKVDKGVLCFVFK